MANKLNKVLRTMFILLSFVLLSLLIGAPKTHCQTCALEFNDKIYNGYEAFEYFENTCISYSKPWDIDYVMLPNLSDLEEESRIGKTIDYINVLEGGNE